MILIKNGKKITAGNDTEEVCILIEQGKIKKIRSKIEEEEGMEVIDAKGNFIAPGFIDVHVHLREPGYEAKETIETGTSAAKAGGYTLVMPMPNLKPVPDNKEAMKQYMEIIHKTAKVHVVPYGSITKGQGGSENTNMEELLQYGAGAFTDDGVGVQGEAQMRFAMEQASQIGTIISAHTEDNSLRNGGYVHEGDYSKKMGWKGIPSSCEYMQLKRDLELVEETDCQYNVCHISAKESVELVRIARKKGLKVSAEVTPHHLLLCDEDVKGPNEKMNPPLRGKEDRASLVAGLIDGTIEIIATDHAPHTKEEKAQGLEKAPFGIVGLETSFPLLYTHLVLNHQLTLEHLILAMSTNPARIFGFQNKGRLEEGYDADIVILDLNQEKTVSVEKFESKGKNSPFDGWVLKGWPIRTLVSNELE